MSLGDTGNYTEEPEVNGDGESGGSAARIRSQIQQLREAGILVVVAAGNDYFRYQKPGMGFPAIVRETISVGAVFDSDIGGPVGYKSGGIAHTTKADQITPFSQRLHVTACKCGTDVFAPGAPIASSGSSGDDGVSVQHGTSQATPVISGLIALVQEYVVKRKGEMPSASFVEDCLIGGAERILDDGAEDNVAHTKQAYLRPDAVMVLEKAKAMLEGEGAPPAASAARMMVLLREAKKMGKQE